MTRAKSLALVFYLGAALAGAAVAMAADRMTVRTASERDPRPMRQRMYEDLQLTGAQRDSATAIYEERDRKLKAVMEKYKAVLEPIRAEQDSVLAEGRRRISQLLTPEQKAIYDQRERERKERASRTEKKQ